MVCRYYQKVKAMQKENTEFLFESQVHKYFWCDTVVCVHFAVASHMSEIVGPELCRSILAPSLKKTECSNLSPSTKHKK